jgi:hypothetical protein
MARLISGPATAGTLTVQLREAVLDLGGDRPRQSRAQNDAVV